MQYQQFVVASGPLSAFIQANLAELMLCVVLPSGIAFAVWAWRSIRDLRQGQAAIEWQLEDLELAAVELSHGLNEAREFRDKHQEMLDRMAAARAAKAAKKAAQAA